ncbi:MAG: helicase-related protein [Polyangiaceae bacterium]
MIDLSAAARLLDFGARIGAGPRAEEQLQGAVALHNILSQQGVAYLADEVGMGKTYVALGAMALFRHFDPGFRVLFIAPRENIQSKWMKELRSFVAHNIRYPDLRVKAIDGRPARALVSCDNLLELVEEATVDPNRDFFLRLTSFSLALGGRDSVDAESGRKVRDRLRGALPWLRDEIFDLRSKQTFKNNVARAVCCGIPTFDLVIIDEAHNLKHGWSEEGAARNRVLSLVLGRAGGADEKLFPNFGPRAERVLFLSATPIDETYRHLWNQLDLVGRSAKFGPLRSNDADEETKKESARAFLVRRVTSISVAGQQHTKNMYRREWRNGGVHEHDQPIRTTDPKQRLVVALVQKKVSELLQSERFGASFQIGMLASFESFLETAGVKQSDDDVMNFDDADQTEDQEEREGIDVRDVNSIARSYRERFNEELPHPKMDALVSSLARSWERGEKSLVFVRRVASVTELKRKLDDCYDQWLIARLQRELPESVQTRLATAVAKYREEKLEARNAKVDGLIPRQTEDVDTGGRDTFFAWFFRGTGPRGFVSGANVQQRFIQRGATYATFFEDNYVADLLACEPSEVESRLAEALGAAALRDELRQRSRRFLSRAKRHARGDRFEAVQAAAVEALKDHPGPVQARARMVWQERFESSLRTPHANEAPDIGGWLGLRTFFTELRQRTELRTHIWPSPATADERSAFRERELRAHLLASVARLGHSLIDLYVMTIRRIGSLDLRAQDETEDEGADVAVAQIQEYLDLLETQRRVAPKERGWRAFDELAEVAEHFELVLDVNAPDALKEALSTTATEFGRLLRQQQPVGGMSGQVNQTLVRQFRMPGYPLVLVTTDLLQEGEDLHTFCSAVHHYGISWTPSAMEQRIGRIDRVRSQTDRRLSALDRPAAGDEMLQVYFPHLDDTVEVLQVQRVLERMNVFLRLMHEGLTTAGSENKKIDVAKELVRGRRAILRFSARLKTAFPIAPAQLEGSVRELASCAEDAIAVEERFVAVSRAPLPDVEVSWEPDAPKGSLFGTVHLASRRQPVALRLQSLGERLLIRCVSPVGRVGPEQTHEEILASVARRNVRIGAIAATEQEQTYDLTVEDDVLLSDDPTTDGRRVAMLLRRVAEEADALEQRHLPGHDETLSVFRSQLEEEGRRDR